MKAHELLHFAKEQGRQLELAERLMSAYFTEGRHLGREDELVALAADAGLDADAAREALQSGRYLPRCAPTRRRRRRTASTACRSS